MAAISQNEMPPCVVMWTTCGKAGRAPGGYPATDRRKDPGRSTTLPTPNRPPGARGRTIPLDGVDRRPPGRRLAFRAPLRREHAHSVLCRREVVSVDPLQHGEGHTE